MIHKIIPTCCLKLHYLSIYPAVHPCDKAETPCKNGAECEALGDQFVCKCAEGWKGETCEEKGDYLIKYLNSPRMNHCE